MTRKTRLLPLAGIALAIGLASCGNSQPVTRVQAVPSAAPSAAAAVTASATPVATPGSLQAQGKYVGATTCKGCHTEIFNTWALTAHNRPADGVSTSFIDKKVGTTPYFLNSSGGCRSCHTLGETEKLKSDPAQDGYDYSKPYTDQFNIDRTGIQCETCHGPASLHIKASTAAERKATISKAFRYDKVCTNCHISGNYKQDWSAGVTDANVNANGRAAPHHPQSMVFDVNGGYTFGQTIPTGAHAEVISKDPYNGCVTCHMSQGDAPQRHDIRLNRDFDLETCRKCHGPTFSVAVLDASQHAFELGLEELVAKLVSFKKTHCKKPTKDINSVEDLCLAWDDTPAGADVKKVFSPNQTTFNRAYWNLHLLEDKSEGVHAPAYEKALLQLSVDSLK